MGLMDSLMKGAKAFAESAGESLIATTERNVKEANDTQLENIYDLLLEKSRGKNNPTYKKCVEIAEREMRRRGLL